jgi:hypothetical protein
VRLLMVRYAIRGGLGGVLVSGVGRRWLLRERGRGGGMDEGRRGHGRVAIVAL